MKEITHDLNHDLKFYCTHNQRSMFRVLGIYNFGYDQVNVQFLIIIWPKLEQDLDISIDLQAIPYALNLV